MVGLVNWSRAALTALAFAAWVGCAASPGSTEEPTSSPDAPDAALPKPPGCTTGSCDASAPFDAGADAPTTTPPSFAPRFTSTSTYSTTVAGSNDPMDVIFPNPPDLATKGYKFPPIVLIQGGNVDKANYTAVATVVAKYGFVVAIPNHTRTVLVLTGLYPEPSSIIAAFAQLVSDGGNAAKPIHNVVDTARYGVMGHSLGSVTGLDLIAQTCTQPACPGNFTSPPQLKGGAFYGASLKSFLGNIPTTNNRSLGAMLIQGTDDGQNAPADAKSTYDKLTGPPRAYVTVNGANHYGIANTNNPSGAAADANTPTLAQPTAIETIGRWSAAFLLATVSGDPAAKAYVLAGSDANATVESAF
jgi:hypothetical protein